jgi:hypothetical protein
MLKRTKISGEAMSLRVERIDRVIDAENIGRYIDPLYGEGKPACNARCLRRRIGTASAHGRWAWLSSIWLKLQILSISNGAC